MNDPIKDTLKAYKKQHQQDHPNHYVWLGMNFSQCETCRDHAHYWKPWVTVRHNSDYSLHERVTVKGQDQ